MWTGINQGVQNLTATGMKLMEMRNQQRHQQALEANQAMQLQENARRHQETIGVQQQQLAETQRQRATAEEAQALAQQKFLAENPDQQPWDMTRFTKMDSKIRLMGLSPDDIPFWNDLKAMAADPKLLLGDVANVVQNKWPEWKAQSGESLYTKASQLSDKAAALPENDPKRKELMAQIDKAMKTMTLIESIPDDKVKQTLFPDIWQKEQKDVKDVKPVTLDQLKAAIAMNPALAKSLSPEQQAVLGITDREAGLDRRSQAAIDAANKRAEEANKTRIKAAEMTGKKTTQNEELYQDYAAGEKKAGRKAKTYWEWYRDEYSKTNPLKKVLEKLVGGETGTAPEGYVWENGQMKKR